MTMAAPGTFARLAPGLLAGLAACSAQGAAGPAAPGWHGAKAEMLADDLMVVRAGAAGGAQVATDYATCAAAQAAQARGQGYLRHLRTNIDERGGVWRADAAYLVSPEPPRGLRVIAAEAALADCAARSIPTV
ncbi:hypothetical protein [Phaeovulum veldkampii]|nr:hypothetical protein [Phaeovulum veldkampii]